MRWARSYCLRGIVEERGIVGRPLVELPPVSHDPLEIRNVRDLFISISYMFQKLWSLRFFVYRCSGELLPEKVTIVTHGAQRHGRLELNHARPDSPFAHIRLCLLSVMVGD